MPVTKKILLIDEDSNYISSLRHSLNESGYELIYWDQAEKALEIIRSLNPDLIISEINLSRINGHDFFEKVKSIPEVKDAPFVFLSSQKRVDDRIKSMELGVDDLIVKPFYIEEVVARIENLLEEMSLLEQKKFQHDKGFTGDLSELGLIELIQTLEMGSKSGIIHLTYRSFEGTVYIREGLIIDAIMNELPPREALMRMFVWTEGTFHVEMINIDHEKRLESDNTTLINQAKNHINLWDTIKRNLPSLDTIVTVRDQMIREKNSLSNFEKNLIKNLNGRQSIYDIILESSAEDLRTLEIISDLFNKGYLIESELDTKQPTKPLAHHENGIRGESGSSSNNKERIITSILTETDQEKSLTAERRKLDRRQYERRESDRKKNLSTTEHKVYLDKAELLLIREKLI
ncbi:response regulator [candidate division KSB1 bacterium]|nr:response regulator [candidate division KSB1 bacterium]